MDEGNLPILSESKPYRLFCIAPISIQQSAPIKKSKVILVEVIIQADNVLLPSVMLQAFSLLQVISYLFSQQKNSFSLFVAVSGKLDSGRVQCASLWSRFGEVDRQPSQQRRCCWIIMLLVVFTLWAQISWATRLLWDKLCRCFFGCHDWIVVCVIFLQLLGINETNIDLLGGINKVCHHLHPHHRQCG